MIDSLWSVFDAMLRQDFTALSAGNSAMLIYLCVALVIWLESAFIPAAPLPCDSVVILSGTLGAMGVIDFNVMLLTLVVSASIGSWFAYFQGSWLHKLPRIKKWIGLVPQSKIDLVDKLLINHGALSLFVARFIPFVRPLLPLMMGLRVNNKRQFNRFVWLSAVAWALILTGFGYSLTLLPESVSRILTMLVMIGPVITLSLAIVSGIVSYVVSLLRSTSKS